MRRKATSVVTVSVEELSMEGKVINTEILKLNLINGDDNDEVLYMWFVSNGYHFSLC